MAWLRGNLHAHTTYSDGVKTPQDLITEYEALGYDFLAITDHEDLIGPSYWRALPRHTPPPLLFHGGEGMYQGFDHLICLRCGVRGDLHHLTHTLPFLL